MAAKTHNHESILRWRLAGIGVIVRRAGMAGRPRPKKQDAASSEERTARVVRRVRAIPAGFVRTYGDIDPRAPRFVGLVLATVNDDLPWHRVVRADGSLAQGKRQRALLMQEGVPMKGNRVDLRRARLQSHL